MSKVFRIVLYVFISVFCALIISAPLLKSQANLPTWLLPIPSISRLLGFIITPMDIVLFSSSVIGICIMLVIISKKFYENHTR